MRARRSVFSEEKKFAHAALGKNAVDAIRDHIERLLADLGAWEAVAVATRLDQIAN